MSEFEKRMVRLNGGLTVSIESKEDEAEFIEALQQVSKKNGPFTTALFRAWAEARGSEIAGRDMHLLDKAKFYPDQTLEELQEKARDAFVRMSLVNETFGDDRLDLKRVDEELEDWTAHCFESSEGVLWIN